MELILTKDWDKENSHTLAVYQAGGGYKTLHKALEMSPDDIIAEAKAANVRGRGGAGFPAGLKWSFVPKESEKTRYLVVNADEGEPGTFKDRYILERSPHMLIEGCLIACLALDIHHVFVYVRGEFVEQANILEGAIAEAYDKGYLGKPLPKRDFTIDMYVHRGAGAYICGEETALLESLEGKAGWPRLKPPFPAVAGLFGGPTVVNNVETLANIPAIIERGGAWFAGLGSGKDGGTKLYGVSGHVNKPGIYELPMGFNLKELIYDVCGGIRDGKKLKGVIPGGSSTPVLLPDEIDVSMTFDDLRAKGSMLGTAGVIVMDETTCMVRTALRLARFYAHESCGQCTPCREGNPWSVKILRAIEAGQGRLEDLELLLHISRSMAGFTICPLGEAAAGPLEAFVTKFKGEFVRHIEEQRCPFGEYPVRPALERSIV